MQTLKKYLLLIFLLENIAAQTFLLRAYSDIVFYCTLILGFIGIVDFSIFKKINFKKFTWAYLLSALYVIYLFFIAPIFIDDRNLQYLAAKIMTFIIIITSISNYRTFYENKGLFWIMIFLAFFLLYGLLTGKGMYGEGRDTAGFTNANTAGGMGAVLIGILIFYLKNRKWNLFYYFLLFIGLYGVIASGSRAGFLVLGLFILFRYGISIKTILMIGVVLFVGFILLDQIGVHSIGMQRVMDTYSGELGSNREDEREAAFLMIETSPVRGWGFDFENSRDANSISEVGPHNGYLELTEQIGIPCSVIFFSIILFVILKNIYLKIKYRKPVDLFLAMVIAIAIKASYESLFVGVHEFETNLFFFALAMVSSFSYKYQRINFYND